MFQSGTTDIDFVLGVKIGCPCNPEQRGRVGTRHGWDAWLLRLDSPILPVDGAYFCPDNSGGFWLTDQADQATHRTQRQGSVTPLVVKGRDTPTIAGMVGWHAVRSHSGNEKDLVSLSHADLPVEWMGGKRSG